MKTVVVAGVTPKSGCSTLAVNLACTFAQRGHRTSLVDLTRTFGSTYALGLKPSRPGQWPEAEVYLTSADVPGRLAVFPALRSRDNPFCEQEQPRLNEEEAIHSWAAIRALDPAEVMIVELSLREVSPIVRLALGDADLTLLPVSPYWGHCRERVRSILTVLQIARIHIHSPRFVASLYPEGLKAPLAEMHALDEEFPGLRYSTRIPEVHKPWTFAPSVRREPIPVVLSSASSELGQSYHRLAREVESDLEISVEVS